MNIDEKMLSELEALRKEIHAHPEISGEEEQTAKRILEQLEKVDDIEVHSGVGGNGIIAVYDTGKEGPIVLLRAELDALPIDEVNDFEYRSKYEDKSHKCGHDGHMVILLGLVRTIVENPPKKGKIYFLWQPAEENGEGAKAVISDEAFSRLDQPDYVLALHNLPGYVKHKVVLRHEVFSASVKSIIIKFKGKTSHAAEPEYGKNPAWPIWKILKLANDLSNNDMSRDDFCVITPIYIKLGDIAYGISAGKGDLRLTIRTWDVKHMTKYSEQLEKGIDEICSDYEIDYKTSWTQEFASNRNNPEVVDVIESVAREFGYEMKERQYPFKWGEDFGLFTQKFKGAMFGLGSGEDTPALHNPDYDFPDELIKSGVELFYHTTTKLLEE
ncbi:MAG: amidohydrolase [Saprospiraceae bacterium]|nr:amidohydrolase [Saprospiraceae bacterium]